MSSSIHIDNKGKEILILGVGPTQGLEHTFTPEKNIFYKFFSNKTEILFKFAL